jgi:hypothetical protein
MTPEQQCTFGAAGIIYILGYLGVLTDLDPQQAYAASEFEGLALMIQTLEPVIDELKTNPPKPILSAFGIRTCRICGCTNSFGCEDGCSWVEKDLCSTCTTDNQPSETA